MKLEATATQSSWLDTAKELNKELQQQSPETQQAMKQLSKRQYRQ